MAGRFSLPQSHVLSLLLAQCTPLLMLDFLTGLAMCPVHVNLDPLAGYLLYNELNLISRFICETEPL